jgi:HK97 family phage major capsid protein
LDRTKNNRECKLGEIVMTTITVPSDEVKNLKSKRDVVLARADARLTNAERHGRQFDSSQKQDHENDMKEVDDLNRKIDAAKAKAAPPSMDPGEARARLAKLSPQFANPAIHRKPVADHILPKRFSRDYYEAFYNRLGSGGGGPISAALYEGSSGDGGFSVPLQTDAFIAPLAPTASDIRSIATVIETTKDILLPVTAPTGLPTTVQTAELSAFAQSVPSLGQTKVTAYLNALLAPVSLELTDDVPGLEAWMRTVVEAALLEQEDALFISGTGSNEPQGLIGNVGAGITAEPDGGSNLVSYAGLSALMGAVKAKYLAGSSWLMSQSTAIVVRAALAYSGATFEWTRDASGDRLFGYPVKYSFSMPAVQRGNSVILFGNFAMGFVVADRGGPAVRLKILDQMFGVNGTLYWLLSRRTDSRVWVQESIQQYTISAS